eukprot:g43837.t1
MVFATACFGMAFRGDGKQTASDNLNTSWELGEGRRGHYVFFKKNATVDLSSRRDLFSRAFFEGEVVLGTPFWCREFSIKQVRLKSKIRFRLLPTSDLSRKRIFLFNLTCFIENSLHQIPTKNHWSVNHVIFSPLCVKFYKTWCRALQSENSEVRVERTLKLGAQRAAFLIRLLDPVQRYRSKTRMLPGHVRARRAPVYVGLLAGAKSRPPTCGLFVDADVLPASFTLGEMRSGSVPIGPATNDAFSQHFTMRLDRGLSIGMQPITLLGPDSRNPMHLINSSSAGFNDGSTSRAHNAKISKKQLVVTLTSDVRRDHEILLSYSQNDALEALSNKQRIPVWTFDLQVADGIHLYFIVLPPAQQPLLEQSRSLSLPEKQVLIRSLSDMPPPRSKTLCITTEKKQQLLDSTVNELFRSSSGASLKREVSRITVLDGEKHLTQQPPIRVLKREASDATVVLARASSSSLMSRIDPFALLEGLVSDAEAETECDEDEALVIQTAPPTEVETACDEDEALVSQTAPPTEVDTECIEDEESEEEIEYDFACPVRRLQPARRSYVIEDVMSSSQPLYVSMGLIWRTEYKNVSFVRDGDFSKDDICTDLVAEHSRGFRTEEEAKDWKRRNQLHHRTHRSCRVASMKRKKGAPSDMFSIVISSDMKPPGEWHGVNDDPNGEPIKIFLKRPEGDLRSSLLALLSPRGSRRTSALSPETYGEGDLPGRPAHMECIDASGKIWRIDLRVLDELPTNWLELPPQRKEKIQALHSLTKEELKNLPRTYIVNDGNPPAHPPWRGAQELTPEEKQAQDIAFASASAPWRKVTHLLRISQNKETFAASHMVMKELKLWLREHGVTTQDKDRKQFVKKKLIDLVWEHSQICSCGLEEDDNKEMKDEVDAPSADEPEPESEQEPESAAAPARGRGGRRGRQAAAAPARGRGRRGGRRRGRRVAGSARGRGGARARKRARSEGDGRSLPSRRRREPAAKEQPKVPKPDGPWECPTCHFFNEQGGERCELCEWPSLSDDSETSTEYDEEMEVDAEESEPEPKSDPEQEPEPAAAPARGRGGRGGRRRGRRVAGSARGGGGARKRARSEEDGKSLRPRRRHQLVIEELPGALSEGEWECPSTVTQVQRRTRICRCR